MLFWGTDHNEGMKTIVVHAVYNEFMETLSYSLMENVA